MRRRESAERPRRKTFCILDESSIESTESVQGLIPLPAASETNSDLILVGDDTTDRRKVGQHP